MILGAVANEVNSSFPNPESFFLREPLYRPVPIPPSNGGLQVLDVEFYDGSLKAHCVQCDDSSVFRTDRMQSGELLKPHGLPHAILVPVPGQREGLHQVATRQAIAGTSAAIAYSHQDRGFLVTFYCTRDQAHRVYFAFAVRNDHIEKIGQFPSLSDFQRATTARYRRILPSGLVGAYTKAINLHSHDVGAGAFVYLRRIIEHLVQEACEKASRWG